MEQKNKTVFFRILFLSLALLTAGVIFFFSSQPWEASSAASDRVSGLLESVLNPFFSDAFVGAFSSLVRKMAHMFLYFMLSLFLCLFFFTFSFVKEGNYFWLPVVCSFVYACLDEFHQTFVSGRTGAVRDVLVDGIGFLMAAAICNLIFYIVRQRKKDATMPESRKK